MSLVWWWYCSEVDEFGGLIVIFYGIVHQADLDLEEKILRHFDLSSQYGVCDGKLYIETCLVSVLQGREALLTSVSSRALVSLESSAGDGRTC